MSKNLALLSKSANIIPNLLGPAQGRIWGRISKRNELKDLFAPDDAREI